jgi:quinol monooxygenase YgiN
MAEARPQVPAGELMMCNTLVVRPECRSAYLKALRKVLPQARGLDGCLLLEVGESIDAPSTFVLTERWRSGTEYLNEYLALPFYVEYLEATEPMYAAPRTVVVLSSVGQ